MAKIWTFMAHWNDYDEVELEYYVEGEVEDPREGPGSREGQLFAESGTGETPEQVWAQIKAFYERHPNSYPPPTPWAVNWKEPIWHAYDESGRRLSMSSEEYRAFRAEQGRR